jgi:D-serine deaminase-like pyridoxal phosphate-dependent protein
MTERVREFDAEFRPHFKTHQSLEVGRWIRDEGVTGITVSSPSMGLYFAEDGWDDITVAFPFYPGMIPDLQKLEQKAKLSVFVRDEFQLSILNRDLKNSFRVYIEVDAGYGRSGIPHHNRDEIQALIKACSGGKKSLFHGFYIHDGRTYAARSTAEIEELIQPSKQALISLKSDFPNAAISLGDTPSASQSKDLHDFDELTPGNFVFYDWMQVQMESCTLDQVALFAVLPVAQSIDGGNKAILHGGAVHLSKDRIEVNGDTSYGQAVSYTNESVELIEGAYMSALSQEHGTLSGFKEVDEDRVWICPVHSCLTANLFDHYLTTTGNKIEKRVLS